MKSVLGHKVIQLAWVVDDLAKARDYWTRVMGVGPFFALDGITFSSLTFRGRPISAKLDIALANLGDQQIELIQRPAPGSDPNIYDEFLQAGGRGFHHVGIIVEDVAAETARLVAAGHGLAQQGCTEAGINFSYVDAGPEAPCTLIELIPDIPLIRGLFGMIADAARDWDGSDPLRHF